MTRRWIITCSIIFYILCNVNGDSDLSMKSICENAKKHNQCEKASVKAQCPDVCGGGGGGGHGTEPPAPPPDDVDTTTKRTITTKSHATEKSVVSKNCDKKSPCISMKEANENFKARCEATNGALAPSCYPHCRYDDDPVKLKKAFMGGPCPLKQLRVYLTAASNSKDNTACCQETGVLAQKKTGVCGCFCNPTGPVWPQKGETMKYAPCVNVLTGIMQCHYYAEGAD